MANHKSALKRMRQSENRRTRNRIVRGAARRAVTRTREAAATADVENAQEWLEAAYSRLDRAAAKGVIHKNNAARRKARLAKLVNKAAAAKA